MPPRQPQCSPQSISRNDLFRDTSTGYDFSTQAVGLGHSRTLYDSSCSRSRPSQSTHGSNSHSQPNHYIYDYDPVFTRALQRADVAGPRTVDPPRPTRLIQDPNQLYNIHMQTCDLTTRRHHALMARNYGLEYTICTCMDRDQFSYVPPPSGYMDVGVDDPFCWQCGLNRTDIDGDEVGGFGGAAKRGKWRRRDNEKTWSSK